MSEWDTHHKLESSNRLVYKLRERIELMKAERKEIGEACTTAENTWKAWKDSHDSIKKERDELARVNGELVDALRLEKKQREDLDDVLNHPGHSVIGWHLNGDSEPVSTFFDDNNLDAESKTKEALALASKAQENQ